MADHSHRHAIRTCNFCGKSEKEIRYLIAGPNTYICNECIDLCNDIIEDTRTSGDALQQAIGVLDHTRLTDFLREHMVEQPMDTASIGAVVTAYTTTRRAIRDRHCAIPMPLPISEQRPETQAEILRAAAHLLNQLADRVW